MYLLAACMHPNWPCCVPPSLQGLDAEGRPLRGAPPTNLIQLYTAVAACTCCNPACANLEGASEQVGGWVGEWVGGWALGAG